MEGTFKSKLVGVLIEKNSLNIIPKRVYMHEIRLLCVLHGIDKVKIDKSSKPGNEEQFESEVEYGCLVDGYGIENVAKAYGEPYKPRIEEALEDYGKMLTDQNKNDIVANIEYKLDPLKLTKDSIVEELEKFDVEIPSDANKEELAETLREFWGMPELTEGEVN